MKIEILKVTGDSLSPILENGDFIIVINYRNLYKKIRISDIIVFDQIPYGIMVKQVTGILDGNEYLVSGTKNNSIGSKEFGPVKLDAIIGKMVFRIKRNK